MDLPFHTSYATCASEVIKNDGQVDGFTHAGSGIAKSSFWPTFANLGQVVRRKCVPSGLAKPSVLRPEER